MGKLTPYQSLVDLYTTYTTKKSPSTEGDGAVANALKNEFHYYEYNDEDHTLIVKQFNQNSYNGPTLHDFNERLNIIFETAQMKLDMQLKNQQFNQTEYEIKLKKIEESKRVAVSALKAHCQIDPIAIDELLPNEKAVIKTVHEATLYIQQFVFDALVVLDPDAFQDTKHFTAGLLAFAADESRLTAEKGRRNFLNIYPNRLDNIMRVSMQRVIGHAIPSTERYGEPRGKLPNFVECGIGYQDAHGNYIPQFNGYRHSSFPTIKVKDDFIRQQNSALTVKDMLTELARKQLHAGNTDSVIKLNLSSLTLLSPISLIEMSRKRMLTDKLILPEGESEHLQLQESYNALMMYNHREIELKVDDKTVKVYLEANLVNAAANPLGVYAAKQGVTGHRLAQSTLEQHINAEGMNRYIERTENYLKKQGIKLPYENELLHQTELQLLRRGLVDANIRLEQYLVDDNKSEYQLQQQVVADLKDKIYKIEVEVMAQRKQSYVNHREDLETYLIGLKHQVPKNKATEIAELYYQSIAMYMDGQVEPAQFGARYLLVNEKMGDSVDFYCKSGEDRTGRVQNLLEELCEFSREKNYFPAYDFKTQHIDADDLKIEQDIAKYAAEFSVCRDINDENVHGARGLQISSALELNQGLPNRSGDAIGKTAKAVFALRDLVPASSLIKKVFPIDTKRQKAIARTLAASRGNVLLETNSMHGFESRIVRAKDRAQYEQDKHLISIVDPDQFRTMIAIDDGVPTYVTETSGRGDLVVVEKTYAIKNSDQAMPNTPLVARLEKDAKSIKDVTQIPKNLQLSSNEDEEIALQQAYTLLSPPFKSKNNPLVLNGGDDAQVARVHAALLFLKDSHPVLKDLVIFVKGSSPRPPVEQSKAKQKEADSAFIKQHLSESLLSSPRKQELGLLIAKEQRMKSLVKAGREESNKLNLVSGAKIKPF